MREQEIVKGLLPEMAQIINAIPGEVYTSKDAETLLIMQRRLSDCDLKRELTKEEKKVINAAYNMGRKNKFLLNTKNNKNT